MKHPRRGPNNPPIPYGIRSFPGRALEIAGVMLHETRSSHPDREDGFGAEAWASSVLNGSPKKPGTTIPVDNPQWGSMWDILIYEGGTQVFMLDIDTEYAAWTAGWGAKGTGTWAAGKFYIQIEIAHGTGTEPYTAVQIDSVAQVVAELSKKYNFPIERIPFLTQVGDKPRGIATHAESANGVKLGKTDPGEAFPWDEFINLTTAYTTPGYENGLAELNDAMYKRLELNALIGLDFEDGDALLVKATTEGWVRVQTMRDDVPAMLCGHPSYSIMKAAWNWSREQRFIPDRSS